MCLICALGCGLCESFFYLSRNVNDAAIQCLSAIPCGPLRSFPLATHASISVWLWALSLNSAGEWTVECKESGVRSKEKNSKLWPAADHRHESGVWRVERESAVCREISAPQNCEERERVAV